MSTVRRIASMGAAVLVMIPIVGIMILATANNLRQVVGILGLAIHVIVYLGIAIMTMVINNLPWSEHQRRNIAFWTTFIATIVGFSLILQLLPFGWSGSAVLAVTITILTIMLVCNIIVAINIIRDPPATVTPVPAAAANPPAVTPTGGGAGTP